MSSLSWVCLCCCLFFKHQIPNPTSPMIHRVVKGWSCSLGGALPSPSFSAERALTMAFIWAKMSQTLIRGEHFSWYQSWIFFSSEANRNPKQTRLERTKNLFTISFQVFSGWDQGGILAYLVQPAKSHLKVIFGAWPKACRGSILASELWSFWSGRAWYSWYTYLHNRAFENLRVRLLATKGSHQTRKVHFF